MTTKRCFKCKKIKEINLFYKHSQMADGHLNKCKTCTKKDVKNRYDDPKKKKFIQEYEKRRNQTENRKRNKLEYQKKRRLNSKGKYKANQKVNNAIRDGRLIRKPCEICGNKNSEAHHNDYRKYLDVRWLCFKHHRELHANLK